MDGIWEGVRHEGCKILEVGFGDGGRRGLEYGYRHGEEGKEETSRQDEKRKKESSGYLHG